MFSLILSLFIAFAAGAVENWYPFGKSGAATTYAAQAACEAAEGQSCFDVTSCLPDVCSLVTDADGKQSLQPDAEKAAEAAATKQALDERNALLTRGAARRAIGTRIIDLISANNDSKSLDPDQTLALTQTLQPILTLLQTGALESAKAKIQALTPSGVITQADIDLTLAQFAIEGY